MLPSVCWNSGVPAMSTWVDGARLCLVRWELLEVEEEGMSKEEVVELMMQSCSGKVKMKSFWDACDSAEGGFWSVNGG